MNLQNRKRLREGTYGCWQRGRTGGIVREFQMDRFTLVYLKWITNKGLLYSIRNSAECYMAGWMGVGFRGEWVHVYV